MATWDESLNIRHISNNLRSYEAAKNGYFVFQVAPNELTNLIKPDLDPDTFGDDVSVSSGELYDGAIASEYLRLNVVKSSVPNFTLETSQYKRGNDVVNFITTPTYADGSFTVDDVVGLGTKSILYSWFYLGYNPRTRKVGNMADYKKTCTLIEYTADYQEIRRWKITGCFITGIDEGEFDRENADKRQLSVSFKFDFATMDNNEDVLVALRSNE